MKKYHIADLLTLCEIILAGILLTFYEQLPPEIVFWIFTVGELCDAFDGICARRWHYPNDGKKRWWRKWAPEIDQFSDIFLLVSTALYLWEITRLKAIYIIAFIIIVFCSFIETLTSGPIKTQSPNSFLFFLRIYRQLESF